MSDCCVIPHRGSPPACPMNVEGTKHVGRKTVECLVRPEAKSDLTSQPYYFCNAPDCDTVYVSALGDRLITKDMLTVRVGIQETDDPIPLCTAARHSDAPIGRAADRLCIFLKGQ